MGSQQSTPVAGTPTVKISNGSESVPVASATDSNVTTPPRQPRASKPKRTGIDAVNHKCRKKKAAYDKCFSEWYNERFLQLKSINQEEECGELFETYKQCYMKGMKREFFDKGQKKPKEGSLLAEELDE
ncbi:expressed unknown protein [Seminavis robusta]|uniref:Uncharacterized protein n=1 Tax=Seminavis robusta TaxID=568900 RepID=A0A9N8DBJ2_9STRA|nr:expressed unknown protein [Seminavis robusta]|eukprot:Sro66_g037210.1 n/a (129) ;mRNA; f:77801-78187